MATSQFDGMREVCVLDDRPDDVIPLFGHMRLRMHEVEPFATRLRALLDGQPAHDLFNGSGGRTGIRIRGKLPQLCSGLLRDVVLENK
jgi:hypothetical protein